VLDAGKVVERGRHSELLAINGVYAALWRRQLESDASAHGAGNPEAVLSDLA